MKSLIIIKYMYNLHDTNQSAYKKCHCTKTALVKIKHDINMAMDQDCGVLLILLNLSTAFDTIDHTTLINRLHSLGIKGHVLQSFSSYLHKKTQQVIVSGLQSDRRPLSIGVPPGSVLGPMLFLIYVLPLLNQTTLGSIKYVPFSLRDPSN